MGSTFQSLNVYRLRFIGGRYINFDDYDLDCGDMKKVDESIELRLITLDSCDAWVNRLVETWMRAGFKIPAIEIVAENFNGEIEWIKKIYG